MIRTLFYPRRFPTLALVVLVVLLGVPSFFAEQLAPQDPLRGNLGARFLPPIWVKGSSIERPLGTDHLGRDVLSRLVYGGRLTSVVTMAALLIGGVIGTLLGF